MGIWSYSPVEIGNMKPEEALRLSETFDYVALGHGHKPYEVATSDGRPYAFNPGSPERVNFGEEKYDKGYYRVTIEAGRFMVAFKPTAPRPMVVATINLDGADSAEAALPRFLDQVKTKLPAGDDPRRPLLELKLVGRVGFHPFGSAPMANTLSAV